MRFPLPPTHKHIFVNNEVHPYYGGEVDPSVLYTEDNGQTWVTAVEAGLPLLPPVKLPPVLPPVKLPITPELDSSTKEEPKPEPEVDDVTPESFEEMEEYSVYCEYAESTYEWHLQQCEGKNKKYQKVTTDFYFLYELIPVNHCDFSQQVSFDHLDKELILEEEIDRNTRSKYTGDPRCRQTYSMFVEHKGVNYEMTLIVTED